MATPSVHFLLILIAVICFFLAAIGRPAPSPISLGWLGLFFVAIDILVGGAGIR